MTCDGKNGSISCSPIKITVADSEMLLSGSSGFDGSLDYVLEVPVTKNLVGKKGYELTLKVPIKGTKDKPVYNPEALMRAASDLVSQAAGQAAKQVIQEQVQKELEKTLPQLPSLIDGIFGR